MRETKKTYENKLGIFGWLGGGRYGIERYAYTLQRLTGLILLLYLLLHIIVTSSRLMGASAWEATMGKFRGPLFRFLEFVLLTVVAYHASNGLRLILTELFGVSIGRPERPIYPYTTSIMRQRGLFLLMMAFALTLVLISLIGFLLPVR